MARKVLILKGSPRANGNCAMLADQVHVGAKEAGADVDVHLLHAMDIRPCNACNACLETNGVCVIKDDMQILYPKIRQADALVIASPVYWTTMSAQVKLVIDRWYAFEAIRNQVWPGKQVGLIVTYNAGPYYAIRTLESIVQYLGMDLVKTIHGSARRLGEIDRQPELKRQAYELGRRLGEAK